ncbi:MULTISPECIES: DegT/DnrJ/EryC1/StrS family aminotransferase [unclassified Haladaptatus]|uniref:DegT/DnrJ/EryC1/StrS family aminotransferase n=1 Tax=unclassified Haladaptatus TaxID=2622732 RepID=UPI00209C4995|nr:MULTISPECIES: DegT/DnrJ/EryC1/StrS family aminotransferase [unclassified Haladaptatus]MCO8245222.1 DegT/DnrJ/EryC1/StrS family aminotransferase [Haladaptatus sp. AB643]MCO8253366.1 DegT/DnrJ/EryC1/StrS family aminotransferase [Haladaptatus sp. AB618]
MIPIANPELGREEIEATVSCIEEGQLADGPEVRRFEDEFAAFCGTEFGVATSNGTTALHAAFEALDIGPGDRVVTSPFSFVASANAIRLAGAEPVFADIDSDTYTLDPYATEQAVRKHEADAILAVHLYGLAAEMNHLQDIAETHDIALIEDAAQAHGAEYDGRPVGSFGDAACFSFYPTKNMTTGEGGMVTSDRRDVAERAASFVNHGRTADGGYDHVRLGHNFRMTSMAAAIGRVQLSRLPKYNEARRANAAYLTDRLRDATVKPPVEPDDCRHVYHQYTIRTEDRDGLQNHLESHGIGTGVYYPTPIHKQPAYQHVEHDAPVSERMADEVLSLPVHPGLTGEDVRTIATTIIDYE